MAATGKVQVGKVRAKDIPGLELARGMSTQYNVCQETVGSKHLKMGVCTHAPDMADLNWLAKEEEALLHRAGQHQGALGGSGRHRPG